MKLANDILGTTICPTNFKQAARRHGRAFARYMLAAQYATSKRVIDAACGGGFGSAWLARTATSVLGMDLDDEMLRLAKSGFNADNLEFRRHDLHEPIEPAGGYDLVVSFETMEHVRDPAVCAANLARALADDGVAMISVPNGDMEIARGDHKEYHERHFSPSELHELLSGSFASVQPRSQVYRKGLRHYARKLIGKSCHHADCYSFVDGFRPQAKTWLAICQSPRR